MMPPACVRGMRAPLILRASPLYDSMRVDGVFYTLFNQNLNGISYGEIGGIRLVNGNARAVYDRL